MAEAMRIMLNEAMRIERAQVIQADPYERTEQRRGYANGFKPKTVATRLGALTVEVPQVRDERAFKPAIAALSSRITRSLGIDVSSISRTHLRLN